MEKNTPVLNEDGQWVIKGSRRPDGTYRKDVLVKEGYVPPDEVKAYESSSSKARSARPKIPGLAAAPPQSTSNATKNTSKKPSSASSSSVKPSTTSSAEKASPSGVSEIESKIATMTTTDKNDEEDTGPQSTEKKLRNLNKKLRQVLDIEEKVSRGEAITADQQDKLTKKHLLEEEISKLR